MRYFLGILLLLSISLDAKGGRRERLRQSSCGYRVNTINTIARKLRLIHSLKGTFEALFPFEPHSVAARHPELYQRLLDLFHERPSHLVALNYGEPPEIGTPMTALYQRISEFAHDIGRAIEGHARLYIKEPEDPALGMILNYAQRFKDRRTKLERTARGCFNPSSDTQLNYLTMHGKDSVCSLWAELRLSLRIGRISLVNVTVKDLIHRQVIRDKHNALQLNYDQQIDHFWFPYSEPTTIEGALLEEADVGLEAWSPGLDYSPDAVAIGESKVFDVVFDENYRHRDDVHDQLRRLLKIASVIGANLGIPPRVYYFFVAGISKSENAVLQGIKRDFNNELLKNDVPTWSQVPVELFIYGDYDLIRNR